MNIFECEEVDKKGMHTSAIIDCGLLVIINSMSKERG